MAVGLPQITALRQRFQRGRIHLERTAGIARLAAPEKTSDPLGAPGGPEIATAEKQPIFMIPPCDGMFATISRVSIAVAPAYVNDTVMSVHFFDRWA